MNLTEYTNELYVSYGLAGEESNQNIALNSELRRLGGCSIVSSSALKNLKGEKKETIIVE